MFIGKRNTKILNDLKNRKIFKGTDFKHSLRIFFWGGGGKEKHRFLHKDKVCCQSVERSLLFTENRESQEISWSGRASSTVVTKCRSGRSEMFIAWLKARSVYVEGVEGEISKSNSIKVFRQCSPEFIVRNWLTWLWRLRSPTICFMQTGDQTSCMVELQFESRGGKIRRANGWHPHLWAGGEQSPSSAVRKEREPPFL